MPRRRLEHDGVYPRTRGGTAPADDVLPQIQGLSPHTRGNQLQLLSSGLRPRSIPAHAGEPQQRSRSDDENAVYPRTRGGTGVMLGHVAERVGLSPHTRGNH